MESTPSQPNLETSTPESVCVANCGENTTERLLIVCTNNHMMHAKCIRRWIRQRGGRVTCPLCRDGEQLRTLNYILQTYNPRQSLDSDSRREDAAAARESSTIASLQREVLQPLDTQLGTEYSDACSIDRALCIFASLLVIVLLIIGLFYLGKNKLLLILMIGIMLCVLMCSCVVTIDLLDSTMTIARHRRERDRQQQATPV